MYVCTYNGGSLRNHDPLLRKVYYVTTDRSVSTYRGCMHTGGDVLVRKWCFSLYGCLFCLGLYFYQERYLIMHIAWCLLEDTPEERASVCSICTFPGYAYREKFRQHKFLNKKSCNVLIYYICLHMWLSWDISLSWEH